MATELNKAFTKWIDGPDGEEILIPVENILFKVRDITEGKMSISKTKFYRWLIAYGLFLTGRNPEQSKSSQGKTIMFIDETQEENQKADAIDIPF